MKRTRYKHDEERTVLTGLIVSDDIATGVFRRLGPDERLFRNRWSNLICGWCREFWDAQKKAPKKHLLNLFARWAKKTDDDDLVEVVEKFLSSLDEDYRLEANELNAKFVIDVAAKYFTSNKLERSAKAVTASLEAGDLDAALEASQVDPVKFGPGEAIDILDGAQTVESMRQAKNEQLITFPNALGKFTDGQFYRDGFVSFVGPEKRGKSFWLQECVYQAVRQKRRVAYFIVGDMSEHQVRRRMAQRVLRHPLSECSLSIPKQMRVDDKGGIRLKLESNDYERASPSYIREGLDKFKNQLRSKTTKLKTYVEPAGGFSVDDVRTQIEDLIAEGWQPDVIVIDYADVLAPMRHAAKHDYRHQINETWIALRGISQEFHCLVITATQAAATAYDAKVIRKTDFSEDKRKAAHVTGMLGINQTPEEKTKGVYRLNWTFLREGHWADFQVVHCAGNLGISRPVTCSYLEKFKD